MPIPLPEEVRCPTCGARQAWADTCRRCKSDLRLLRAAAAAYEQHRRHCVRLLSDGAPTQALPHALDCHSLAPGPESERLLALCQLLQENWADAWEGAMRSLEAEGRSPQ